MIANGVDRDGAFVRAQTVVDDRNQGGLAGFRCAADDVQHAQFERYRPGLEVGVSRPQNELFNLK